MRPCWTDTPVTQLTWNRLIHALSKGLINGNDVKAFYQDTTRVGAT